MSETETPKTPAALAMVQAQVLGALMQAPPELADRLERKLLLQRRWVLHTPRQAGIAHHVQQHPQDEEVDLRLEEAGLESWLAALGEEDEALPPR